MDRKEAIEYAKFRLECHTKGDGEYTDYGEFLVAAIEALQEPERKKGKWISALKDDGDSLLRCSICNYPVSYFWGRTNFCPECGADLRGNNNGKIKTEDD